MTVPWCADDTFIEIVRRGEHVQRTCLVGLIHEFDEFGCMSPDPFDPVLRMITNRDTSHMGESVDYTRKTAHIAPVDMVGSGAKFSADIHADSNGVLPGDISSLSHRWRRLLIFPEDNRTYRMVIAQ